MAPGFIVSLWAAVAVMLLGAVIAAVMVTMPAPRGGGESGTGMAG